MKQKRKTNDKGFISTFWNIDKVLSINISYLHSYVEFIHISEHRSKDTTYSESFVSYLYILLLKKRQW